MKITKKMEHLWPGIRQGKGLSQPTTLMEGEETYNTMQLQIQHNS